MYLQPDASIKHPLGDMSIFRCDVSNVCGFHITLMVFVCNCGLASSAKIGLQTPSLTTFFLRAHSDNEKNGNQSLAATDTTGWPKCNRTGHVSCKVLLSMNFSIRCRVKLALAQRPELSRM